jgi:type I restriction enzyme M protein
MTANEIKQLEDRLWKAADDLRANSKLTASEYSFPVLGLIFLRHAHNRFVSAKKQIEKTLPVHPVRGVRAINKSDFLTAKAIFLPESAQWETLANLPDSVDIGEKINQAMRDIESEYEALQGVLPKDYQLFEKDLLQRLMRIFNDEALNFAEGDVFGRIYEYFLNKFAMSGASEGGEFFTPPSLVNAIVNIIEPNHGKVADLAVGSAGMFVQTAHFIEEEGSNPSEKVIFYGQEKTDTNTKLAKMNMAVHGLEGAILQGNTFYEDKHELVGDCDFLMANPPFNVDGVDKSKDAVKNDPRLPFGLPKNDNANYLWIQYFYSCLNETGRAGFVMASSASDAGHSEKAIRKQLVETGAVDVMVSIGTKFFYTLSLPCTLWFFDRSKEKDEVRKDQILMLDLRDVYRKVSSNLHDFTPEHLKSIHALVAMYRGDSSLFNSTVESFFDAVNSNLDVAKELAASLCDLYYENLKTDLLTFLNDEEAEQWNNKALKIEDLYPTAQIKDEYATHKLNYNNEGALQTLVASDIEHFKKAQKGIQKFYKDVEAFTKKIASANKLNSNKDWKEKVVRVLDLAKQQVTLYTQALNDVLYYNTAAEWLIARFPEGEYQDIEGLCKIVNREDVTKNDYSLTAGRYVGVAAPIDEDFDYEGRMTEIKTELQSLDKEAQKYSVQIMENFEILGL